MGQARGSQPTWGMEHNFAKELNILMSPSTVIWRRLRQPTLYSCLENPMDRGAWWAVVHGITKSRTRLSNFTFTFHFHALEKEMATHSSVLAWRIPGTGEHRGLPSMGLHKVGYDWSDLAAAALWFALPTISISYWKPPPQSEFARIFQSFTQLSLLVPCWFWSQALNQLTNE